jgi:hypothetical protein
MGRRYPEMALYECSNNPEHVFDKCTADGICPSCDYGEGILVMKGGGNGVEPGGSAEHLGSIQDKEGEFGHCVLVMDRSSSMGERAFRDSPATKSQMVSNSAALGILALKDTTNPKSALISIVGFNTEAEHVLTDTVKNLVEKYRDPRDFIKFFRDMIDRPAGRTDINKGLLLAREIYDDLVIRGDLSRWGGPGNVRPIEDPIINRENESVVVPNVRVLIYTDGEDTENDAIINPFASEPVDILMGGFFGQGEEPGCARLRDILSECPLHGVRQFFLINDPGRYQTLRRLFRMASGTSGFCPVCLAEANAQGKECIVPDSVSAVSGLGGIHERD